jgi:hypothetical protein
MQVGIGRGAEAVNKGDSPNASIGWGGAYLAGSEG